MIVTVTPNPSIDRTLALPSPLTRGAVHRVTSVTSQAGGKGVNVARALQLAGLETVAVLPACNNDPLINALQSAGVPHRIVPTAEPARTNLTVTEPDGTTTKLNEPGAQLDAASVRSLTDTVLQAAAGATWVVLSGSLPPGVPSNWYADIVSALAGQRCQVAVDTSDAPLDALVASLNRGAPDLIKPNAEELAGALGYSPESLDHAAAQGDPEPVVSAARQLIDRGVGAVLATLGAAGAVLVDRNGAWLATPPPIVPRSTVGAGDSSLAGYVRAEVGGAAPAQRLQMAVAYGSAAAALPGTTLPSPPQIDLNTVQVYPISPIPASR
ncbi:MAG: 1-phosphofructokinase [Mycolicibacterium sp.]|uniref:1-phosphofructokinase n=1 Tax=Mycolicibacterium sp. TaxID=2320850 RepID=UPI003D0ED6B7